MVEFVVYANVIEGVIFCFRFSIYLIIRYSIPFGYVLG